MIKQVVGSTPTRCTTDVYGSNSPHKFWVNIEGPMKGNTQHLGLCFLSETQVSFNAHNKCRVFDISTYMLIKMWMDPCANVQYESLRSQCTLI